MGRGTGNKERVVSPKENAPVQVLLSLIRNLLFIFLFLSHKTQGNVITTPQVLRGHIAPGTWYPNRM